MIYQIQFGEMETILASYPGEIHPTQPLAGSQTLTEMIGKYVIFRLNEGEEIGKVIKLLQAGRTYSEIIRIATQEDIDKYEEIVKEEKRALSLSIEKAKDMPIKIVSAHIQFDNSILQINFIAEKKIGLRGLTKELAKVFKQKIKFRQIGVRTYARQFNSIGVCGRVTCCRTFLNEFKPITVDLMKLQNLSCGTAKLTGICGKLMCCLSYEKENYQKQE